MNIVVDQALPAYEHLFAPLGRVIALPGEAITRETVRDADVLLVRSRTRINESLLGDSSVQFVGSGVAGLDHVDTPYLHARGIPFVSAPGCNANAVAEYILAALWQHYRDDPSVIMGKTMAIIGVGHVGRAVGEKAEILGLHCLYNDPPRARIEHFAGAMDLETCLQNADIVTLHTPLTTTGDDATYHLIHAAPLAKLKQGAILINAARGDVIDEKCLSTRRDLKLLFDCWHGEPQLTPATLAATRLATPHIAGYSAEANLRGGFVLYQALCAHFNLPEAHCYQALLPPAPPPLSIRDPQRSIHALLGDLLDQTTPLRHLDHALRAAAPDTRDVFKQLRPTCQHRREWSAYRLLDHGVPEDTQKILCALGFRFV